MLLVLLLLLLLPLGVGVPRQHRLVQLLRLQLVVLVEVLELAAVSQDGVQIVLARKKCLAIGNRQARYEKLHKKKMMRQKLGHAMNDMERALPRYCREK